jgi:hypothetical protein
MQLLGAASAIRGTSGSLRPRVDVPYFERLEGELQERMGAKAFDGSTATGAALDFAAAVRLGTAAPP